MPNRVVTDSNRYISSYRAARQKGISYSSLIEAVKQGSIPSVKLGSRYLLDSRWLDQYLATANPQMEHSAEGK